MFAVLAYSILTLSVDRGAGFVSIFLLWFGWIGFQVQVSIPSSLPVDRSVGMHIP